MNVDQHVSKYLKVVEDLKGEISELKERLKMYENESVPLDTPSTNSISKEKIENYEETIRNLKMKLEVSLKFLFVVPYEESKCFLGA